MRSGGFCHECVACSVARSSMAQSGIEQRDEKVNRDVDQDEDYGERQDEVPGSAADRD